MKALTKMSRVGVARSRARCCPSLGRTQVLVLKPVALALFAVGNHIPARPPPALSLPCSGPSAPRLIPGSLHRYRSALAPHQRAKKCSPPLVACQSLPPLIGLYNLLSCLSFFFFVCVCLKRTSNLRFLDTLRKVETCCTLIKPAYFDLSVIS